MGLGEDPTQFVQIGLKMGSGVWAWVFSWMLVLQAVRQIKIILEVTCIFLLSKDTSGSFNRVPVFCQIFLLKTMRQD